MANRVPEKSTLLALLALPLCGGAAIAGDFESVQYDSHGDQLVITMVYDGTNPDHHFSTKWGPCRRHNRPDGKLDKNLISVDVLDDQWNDAAQKHYAKTFRVPLTTLAACRPVTVTLWTPPSFSRTLDIP